MTALIGLFDYGSGNLHSANRALTAAGARVILTSDLDLLARCQGLVVPGVGAFSACMAGLTAAGGVQFIRDWVAGDKPLLGICVGHQVLFSRGVEHGIDTPGIGIHPGTVEPLIARRLPHMGWNTVQAPADSMLLRGITDQRFYFVHSYGVHETNADGTPTVQPGASVTWAEHEGDRFIAAVEWRQVTSTQFHPEKSGVAGARLLRNWLATITG